MKNKKIIVVGSGVAGLISALELSAVYDVTLVTKARLSESNTRYAQGGIAAVMFEDDTVAEHKADTLRAGAELCDPEAVEVLCSEGPDRIRDLIAIGVAFDRHDGELARGLEAAHSHARVLHAGGDATGLAIETALVNAVRKAPIVVLEHTFACDLVLEDGHVEGLQILDREGQAQTLDADAVILASGGAGHLYPYTTNPEVATGDGAAIALRAGALLQDVEFYQFHPTALAAPGNFLISEAVRGAGAVLRGRDGDRFMQALHPDAELAPRDVVARGIAAQIAAQQGEPILLDATALGEEYLKESFPTIDAASRKLGLDWAKEPLPVAPAAHYWMGGVRTDLYGRSSLPGLFAVGEVACTGVHGANRLASNSLLESLVFSWRVAHLLLEDGSAVEADNWPDFDAAMNESIAVDAIKGTIPATREQLQALLWKCAGLYRDATGLREGLLELEQWCIPGNTIAQRETANMLLLGKAVMTSALARCESRGAHFRNDFPKPDAALQRSILVRSERVVR